MRTSLLLVAPLGLALCLLGLSCSRGQGPATAVTGRVTFNGAALQTGTIVFVPDSTRGERGPIALGTILPDGSYALKTGETQGASAGWYRVTVTSLSTVSALPGQSFNFPQSLIPEKYRDPELSLLVCEVKANQLNTIDFHLK